MHYTPIKLSVSTRCLQWAMAELPAIRDTNGMAAHPVDSAGSDFDQIGTKLGLAFDLSMINFIRGLIEVDITT
jgi:hypothetical protein